MKLKLLAAVPIRHFEETLSASIEYFLTHKQVTCFDYYFPLSLFLSFSFSLNLIDFFFFCFFLKIKKLELRVVADGPIVVFQEKMGKNSTLLTNFGRLEINSIETTTQSILFFFFRIILIMTYVGKKKKIDIPSEKKYVNYDRFSISSTNFQILVGKDLDECLRSLHVYFLSFFQIKIFYKNQRYIQLKYLKQTNNQSK